MILRPYQSRGKLLVKHSFKKGNQAVVLCVPTGGGKTVMFSDMALEAVRNGVKVMILCHRAELIDQAKDKLNQYGLFPTVINPDYRDTVSDLYLASIDTLNNRKLPDVGLIITDEAHNRDFDETVLYYKSQGAYIVGATASPIRQGKRFFKEDKMREEFKFLVERYPDYSGQMADVYDDIVIPTTIEQLLKDGYLSPAVTHVVKIDLSKIKTKKKFGELEFDENEIFKIANNPISYTSVVKKYQELAAGTKAICFNINVEHSKRQTQEFIAHGIPAVHVDGKTSKKERKKAFQGFKNGIYLILCNCGIATTGYDEPSILTVINNYATLSLSKWLQCNGRGSRLYPGKDFFKIIDMYGNFYRHWFWEYPHEWTLSKEYIPRAVGVAPIRECEDCGAIIPLQTVTCEYCNFVQTKKAEEVEQAMKDAGEFMVADKNTIPTYLKKPVSKMTMEELEKYRDIKGHQIAWAVRQIWLREEVDHKQLLWNYAEIKRYSSAWVHKQISIHNEGRDQVKQSIWDFMQLNTHIDEELLKKESIKKLKSNHTQKEIDALIPQIIQYHKGLKDGTLIVEN